ncbi:MAG: soluble lytic murein [Geobacteraceae bacterium]|nr:MAG: soluble lytic murein [Geobacteraceae bacterium]
MFLRFTACAAFFLLLSVPAAGVNLYQLPDDALATAAAKLKAKEYKGARDAALNAIQSGARDFLAGIASSKLADWEVAATYLGRAAEGFPLLADYALYHQAQALYKLARYKEVPIPLQVLLKQYPDSPLVRSASLLIADALYENREFQEALTTYLKFIEKYPSGSDSLSALYRTALCREQLGDAAGAVTTWRTIWLTYPASAVAVNAATDLQRMAAKGVTAAPYSSEELFRRGVTLYDLNKFGQAVTAFTGVPKDGQADEFAWRLALKTGQALFKARRYKEAEQTFAELAAKNPKKGIAVEARYWLARSMDKNGREDEAAAAYLKLAESSPESDLADNAIFEAAFIRKFQKKRDDTLSLLKRLLTAYPQSSLTQGVVWQIAWENYQGGDPKSAAEYFRKLVDQENTREKALYWYGHALTAAGDTKGAEAAFSSLLSEYPLGFYALSYRKETNTEETGHPPLPQDPRELLPIPAGHERAKALIAFGLYDEARKEIAAWKKKPAYKNKTSLGLARLYLEMGDFHGALALLRQERPRKLEKDTLYAWGIHYPLAYSEFVAKNAAKSGIPASLIYSIIRAESSFSPVALSPAGAVGLMQLMPATAAIVSQGGTGSFDPDRLTQPAVNIDSGVRHLKDLLATYNGDLVCAVAAYNAGAGNVNRWRKNFGEKPADEFIENIPFAETREYVKKVLAGAEIYRRLYGLDTPPAQPPTSPMVESRPHHDAPVTGSN